MLEAFCAVRSDLAADLPKRYVGDGEQSEFARNANNYSVEIRVVKDEVQLLFSLKSMYPDGVVLGGGVLYTLRRSDGVLLSRKYFE